MSRSQFGAYQILRSLGSGGFGQVFLAQRGPKVVALKILTDLDLESMQRFTREAEVLTQVENLSYFGRIHDFGLSPSPYIAMEYIDAPNLKQWILSSELKPTEESSILDEFFLKIVEGLAEFHALGLVHRDLKPQNILVREHAGKIEPVIIDFGLVNAKNFESLTQSGALLGTPVAMAPEQWRGGPEASRQTVDIWALGVIYYFMKMAEFPFSGSPMQLIEKLHDKHIDSKLQELDAVFRNRLLLSFKEDPQQRSQNCETYRQLFIEAEQVKEIESKSLARRLLVVSILMSLTLGLLIAFFVHNHRLNTQKREIREHCKKLLEYIESSAELQLISDYCLSQLPSKNCQFQFLSTEEKANIKDDYQELARNLSLLKPGNHKTRQKQLEVLAVYFATQSNNRVLELTKRDFDEFKIDLVQDQEQVQKLANAFRQELKTHKVKARSRVKSAKSFVAACKAWQSGDYLQAFHFLSQGPQGNLNQRNQLQAACIQVAFAEYLDPDHSDPGFPEAFLTTLDSPGLAASKLLRPFQVGLNHCFSKLTFEPAQPHHFIITSQYRSILIKLMKCGFGLHRPRLELASRAFELGLVKVRDSLKLFATKSVWETQSQSSLLYIYVQSLHKLQQGKVSANSIPPIKLLLSLNPKFGDVDKSIGYQKYCIPCLVLAFESGFFHPTVTKQMHAFFQNRNKMQSREFTVLTPKQQQLWDFLCLLGVTTSNLSPESSWHKYASAFSELAKFEVAELSSELKLYRRYTLLRYAVELYERQKGVGKNEQEVLQTIRAGLKLGEGQLYQELDNYSRQLQKSGFQFQFLVDQQRMRYLHRANQAKAALAASQSAVKDAQRWSTVFQNQEGTERHLWNTVCGLDLASQKKRLESAGRILKVHVGTEALLRETEVYLEQHISPHRPTHFADLDLLFWYSVKVGKTKKQQQLEGLLKPGLEREKFKVRLMRHATK